jgi:hypothetical protein
VLFPHISCSKEQQRATHCYICSLVALCSLVAHPLEQERMALLLTTIFYVTTQHNSFTLLINSASITQLQMSKEQILISYTFKNGGG